MRSLRALHPRKPRCHSQARLVLPPALARETPCSFPGSPPLGASKPPSNALPLGTRSVSADTDVFCDLGGPPILTYDVNRSSAPLDTWLLPLPSSDGFACPAGNPLITRKGINLPVALAYGIPPSVCDEWRSGANLLWTGLPKPFYRPNYSSVLDNITPVCDELDRLAGMSKIRPWRGPGPRPRVVSPMGVILKDLKTRMIVDMTASGVNGNLHNPHFAMPTIDSALQVIRPGDWLGKIDLTDAFLNFPLKEEDQTLFGVQHPKTGQFWVYTCLPFGNSNSPYKFVTFSSYLLDALARQGLDDLICYMDDYLIRGASAFECELKMRVLLRFFRRLNLPVKDVKTMWPSRRMDFLGIMIDTHSSQSHCQFWTDNRVTFLIICQFKFPKTVPIPFDVRDSGHVPNTYRKTVDKVSKCSPY